jgi:hypothetical protein
MHNRFFGGSIMQRNLKKLWPTIATSLVVYSSVVHAQGENNAQMRNLENRVTALEQRKGASGMVNPPGRPQVRNGADLFVDADLIYWNAHENGLNYAILNESSNPTHNLADAEVKNIHGKWNWGFRVGVGYNLPHDGWDLRLNWLRFTDNAHKRVHTDGDEAVFPTNTHPADPVAQNTTSAKAHANWHLRLNQLDLDMGREFFVSKWLTLRPHFGLRSDWIRQELNSEYNNFSGHTIPNEVEAEKEDRWWGIGLEGGLDTQWGLGGGWSIFGNLTAAIIYGFHHLEFEDEDSAATVNQSNGASSAPNGKFAEVENHYRVSHPILDLQMGLRWDNMFGDDSMHLGVQIGWEHHVYFSQNQFPTFVDDFNFGTFVANQGDLTLQGWTFSARFDF